MKYFIKMLTISGVENSPHHIDMLVELKVTFSDKHWIHPNVNLFPGDSWGFNRFYIKSNPNNLAFYTYVWVTLILNTQKQNHLRNATCIWVISLYTSTLLSSMAMSTFIYYTWILTIYLYIHPILQCTIFKHFPLTHLFIKVFLFLYILYYIFTWNLLL